MIGNDPETALAYWAVAPGRGEIRAVPLRPPGAHEVLVQTRFSGVSRGTEALVALGRVPASQWTAMRAPFQAGEFPFPVKYGYAAVGTVVEGPPGIAGRDVFCLHPHQTAYVVPAAAVIPLPAGVPPGRAVLAANMETALNVVWDAAAMPGERVHVIGAGVVGCLIAWLILPSAISSRVLVIAPIGSEAKPGLRCSGSAVTIGTGSTDARAGRDHSAAPTRAANAAQATM